MRSLRFILLDSLIHEYESDHRVLVIVILTRKGKPLAAVNDLSDADWESVSLANNP